MKLREISIGILFFFSSYQLALSQGLSISSLLPNTDDDANNEYLEIINCSDSPASMSGFSLIDLSGKAFIFGDEILQSKESKKYYRPLTKIILNNSDEQIWLKDQNLNISDSFSYSTSQKNIPIITGHSCPQNSAPPAESDSGTVVQQPSVTPLKFTSTGSISEISSTGALISGIIGSGTISIRWGSSELSNTGIIEGGVFRFENLLESNSYSFEVVLSDGSGNITDSFSSGFNSLKIPLQPKELHYSDSDSNGKIDTLEIGYNKTLTGVLNKDLLAVYSNTGGLSSSRIDTKTGLIDSYSFSGTILLLKLLEQDVSKTILRVNNSTSSDLRLKTYSGFGLKDLNGNEAEPLTLTTSFNDYKDVFQKQDPSVSPVEVKLSGGGNDLKRKALPEIRFSFQQPSYVTLKSGYDDIYVCDQDKDECKINIDLEDSFTGGFSEHDFHCEILFGTGLIQSCNPSTVTISTGSTIFTMKMIDNSDSLNEISKTIIIENIKEKLIMPDPLIEIQSGLDSGGYCNKEECSINLDGEKSFAGLPNSRFLCRWDFGGGVFTSGAESSCNPSYIKYRSGEFLISFSIVEKADPQNSKTSYLKIRNNYRSILNPSSDPEVPLILKDLNIRIQTKADNKKFSYQTGSLICYSDIDCQINLIAESSGDPKGKLFQYHWDFGNGMESMNHNPPSMKFSSGDHLIKLMAKDRYYNVLETILEIKVMKPSKEEKPKEKEVDDFKEFKKLLKEMEDEVKDELKFERLLDDLFIKVQKDLDAVSNLKINIQGKNKKLKMRSGMISCSTKKFCNINLGLAIKGIKGAKYIWDFGNGMTYVGKNPKSIKYFPGTYQATLIILDGSGNTLSEKKTTIIIKKLKALKKKKKKGKAKKKKEESLAVSIKSGMQEKMNKNDWKVDLYAFVFISSMISICLS